MRATLSSWQSAKATAARCAITFALSSGKPASALSACIAFALTAPNTCGSGSCLSTSAASE
jgi:hypothetical protein